MTVTVGKKSLVLGWEIAVVTAIGILGFGWGAKGFVDDLLQTQKDIKSELASVKQTVSVMSRRDSVDHIQTKDNSEDIDSIKRVIKPATVYGHYMVQTKDKNGSIHWHSATSN